MKDLLAWWFFPKRAKLFSSIIKIIIGLVIISRFCSTLIGNIGDLIDAYENPPLYLDKSILLHPIIYSLFFNIILWGGLFCLPYYIFRKRSEGKKRYLIQGLLVALLVALIIGSFYASGAYTKPTKVEITRRQLAIFESYLGKPNVQTGKNQHHFGMYTLTDFGNEIKSMFNQYSMDDKGKYTNIGGVPEYMRTKEYGFSDLVLFYDDCSKDWAPYYDLYYNRYFDQRDAWRKEHPEVEAEMLLWGKIDKSVFGYNSAGGKEERSLLDTWVNQYGITKEMMPKATYLDLKPNY